MICLIKILPFIYKYSINQISNKLFWVQASCRNSNISNSINAMDTLYEEHILTIFQGVLLLLL